MAQHLVETKFAGKGDSELYDKLSRNMVITEDYALMSSLAKHAKTALSEYKDNELAALISDKRLTDFKQALALRNVMSMDSPGTYSWIIHQSRKNRTTLGSIPSFDELFAKITVGDLMKRLPMEISNESASYSN